ncbi:hypothetical protein CDD80_3860 [Ophiocordyceps camponoti-rufipedis]|uniref:peptide-methionine (S)-S-oxide reductase n=1 Tax=Ophiocordyceps camponoti-rufipedis TaxID=2004952 RepID=A0A2C5YX81_9HYPO|nr:hypothetical protein CDD80_3860 [Ophiocordyceps camponoti-rufipedis]
MPASTTAAPASDPDPPLPEGAQRCTLAAGCFWGVEHLYRRHFGEALVGLRVGYTGGALDKPSYRAVCGGDTGHAEATQIDFDPQKVSYRQLLEFFFRIHDPTTPNRQGPDTGSQYRSAIFYHSPEQETTARRVAALASDTWWRGAIVTQILPAGRWWSAEEYHQLYLQRNPGGYECPSHIVRDFPPLPE